MNVFCFNADLCISTYKSSIILESKPWQFNWLFKVGQSTNFKVEKSMKFLNVVIKCLL